jgi:hypothetical protein
VITRQGENSLVPIIVVGGASKGVGKTALICGLIASLPDLQWTAIKLTGHTYEPSDSSFPRPENGGDHETSLGAPSFQRPLAGRVGSDEPQPSIPIETTIWEETLPGQGTDTARYLAAGARRAILITATELTLSDIDSAIGPDTNVIFESNTIMNVLEPDVCLAIVGGLQADTKPSFEPLMERADAFVRASGWGARSLSFALAKPLFQLASFDNISPEMLEWLRAHLSL